MDDALPGPVGLLLVVLGLDVAVRMASAWAGHVESHAKPDDDLAELDRVHRAHSHVEDRVKDAKDTGLKNLPFRDFAATEVWLELSLMVQDVPASPALLAVGRSARCRVPAVAGAAGSCVALTLVQV